jgi:GWxTD domain-containing protein
MTAFRTWIESASANALGWTLLHSLWEGAAVALALAIVLSITRSPRIRYAAACLAMLALLAGSGVTFFRLMPRDAGGPAAVRPLPLAARPPIDDLPVANTRMPWDASDVLPWLAPLWMAGVLLFQIRCLASWLAAGRLRRTGVCGAPDKWVQRLDGLRERLRMTKPVALLESCLAEVPVVIGLLRPVILIPVGLLNGLPVGQIEAILLHELAHIRRADYLVNLMQTLMEGLLFYHPAVWWISSVIRAERENCCDDLVVATSGDAHEYATALAALAENRMTMREAALAATGGNLVKRIRRLLAQPEGPRATIAPFLSAGIVIVTCTAVLAAWQSPQQSSPAIKLVIPAIPAPTVQLVAQAQAKPAVSPVPSPQPVAELQTQDSPAVAKALEQLRELTERIETARRGRSSSMMLAQNDRAPLSDPALIPYMKWLNEEAVYIITDEERKAFKSLPTNDERNMFIRQFWARRDPAYPKAAPGEYPIIPKGNPENEFRREHYRRIAYANDRFGTKIAGWKTDRGRIYIIYGPPDEIESHPSGGTYTRPAEQGGGQTSTYPFEQWMYRFIDGIGKNVVIEFVDKTGTGDYRMTMDPNEKDALLFVPKAGITVYRLLGGSGKAILEITPDRKMQVTIPFEFHAKEYLVTLSALSQDGQPMWSKSELIANPCEPGPLEAACLENNPRKMTSYAPSPGSYTLKVLVKDTVSLAQNTYVVNFFVK